MDCDLELLFLLPSEPETTLVDIVNSVTRSRMMAGIRGVDTKPELVIRHGLHALGFRYRLHVRTLPGRPDMVLPKFGVVLFINGCFWHAHEGCSKFKIPSTRTEFWTEKLLGNRRRDERNILHLKEKGWRVAVIWECAINEDELTIQKLAYWMSTAEMQIQLPKQNCLVSSSGIR